MIENTNVYTRGNNKPKNLSSPCDNYKNVILQFHSLVKDTEQFSVQRLRTKKKKKYGAHVCMSYNLIGKTYFL